eukprot:gene39824-49214_t
MGGNRVPAVRAETAPLGRPARAGRKKRRHWVPAPTYGYYRDDPAQEAQGDAGNNTGKMKTGTAMARAGSSAGAIPTVSVFIIAPGCGYFKATGTHRAPQNRACIGSFRSRSTGSSGNCARQHWRRSPFA